MNLIQFNVDSVDQRIAFGATVNWYALLHSVDGQGRFFQADGYVPGVELNIEAVLAFLQVLKVQPAVIVAWEYYLLL